MLAQFTRQCALGAVSNHFDRIDEVLALRTKLSVPLGLRQVFEWHFALDLLALISEALQQRRLDLDLLPQLSAFLLKSLELLSRGLKRQNMGAELGFQAQQSAPLATDLLVHPPMSGIDHDGGFGKRSGPVLDQAV